jgi:glycosyltransferase involved in cell wall biosynthesis
VRDLWPETLVAIGGYRRNSMTVKILGAVEKFLCRHADRIIYVMPNAGDYIAALGIPRNKIACIPNGVDIDLYENTQDDLPKDLDELTRGLREEHKIIIGYKGAHGTADALDTIIDAADIIQKNGFKDIFFILVGDGPDKKKLVEKAGRLDLTNITFHEPIPKLTLPAFLKATDAVIITKQKTDLYRFGMSFLKLYDYMMSAKPVIWAVESVNNPVAEAGCGISTQPENAEALAGAVMKIFRMTEQERRLMGMRGHDYVIKYHSSTVLAQKLLKVINELQKR